MHIEWKFEHKIRKTAVMHGYMLYFDAFFDGDDKQLVLHTGPEHPPTHWYSMRMLFEEAVGVNRTQVLQGSISMHANTEQCFDTWVRVNIPAIGIKRELNYDMKDPEYRGIYQYY